MAIIERLEDFITEVKDAFLKATSSTTTKPQPVYDVNIITCNEDDFTEFLGGNDITRLDALSMVAAMNNIIEKNYVKHSHLRSFVAKPHVKYPENELTELLREKKITFDGAVKHFASRSKINFENEVARVEDDNTQAAIDDLQGEIEALEKKKAILAERYNLNINRFDVDGTLKEALKADTSSPSPKK